MRVIKAKMKGKKADLVAEEPPRDAKVIDLMERLRRSLDASGKGGGRRVVANSTRSRTARRTSKRASRSARPRARATQRRRAS